jgi:hypothetical protein
MRDTITIPATLLVQMYRAMPGWENATLEYEQLLAQLDPLLKLCELPRLHITGTRWFNPRSGTTYYRFRIHANGEQLHESEQYSGYGEQPLYSALNWLHVSHPEWMPGWDRWQTATIYLREKLQATWDLRDVSREKDL